ncbi:MAG: fibronectin type III domain-containing protein [Flavobacteriales bacterium]
METATKAQAVHDAVVANAAAFPNPLPTSSAKSRSTTRWRPRAAVDPESAAAKEYRSRRSLRSRCRRAQKQWGGYVQMQSGGDATDESSAWKWCARAVLRGELPPPRNLGARLTNKQGCASLVWEREYGADMHHVYMSTSNDPFNWELIGVTTKSRFNADSLEPGKFYWFAVSAIGAAGESSMSEPCRVMAAA